jgi:Cu-Zn family superoxide dismutase
MILRPTFFNKLFALSGLSALLLTSTLPLAEASAKSGKSPQPPKQPIYAAQAEIFDTSGKARGVIGINEANHGVTLHVSIEGLAPQSYGIHFHEAGICEGPDFKTAGGHFNPDGKEHGLENHKGSHAGDLPNLVIAHTGRSEVDLKTSSVTLHAGKNSLFGPKGTSIVIHEKSDDQKSNPAGDSGRRILCGVVKKSKVEQAIIHVAAND